MKIEINKKHYEKLLKAVFLGNWLVNAIRTGRKDDPKIPGYDEIEQHIFSFAKEFGLDNFIEYDKKYKKFFPTREFEDLEEMRSLIEDYDEDNFWDVLFHRLAERDFHKEYGLEQIGKMELFERFEKEDPHRERWAKEIDKYGVERLTVAIPIKFD